MKERKREIIYKSTDELIPYINNPRDNEEAVDLVASSIKNFGFNVPIVIDKNNEIVTGHTRLKAAKKLNINKVPCIVADDLSPAEIKAFRLADNKVAEASSWDYDLLNIELEELDDFDMSDFGFIDNFDIDMDALDEMFEPVDEDHESNEPKTIKCPHCGEIIEI